MVLKKIFFDKENDFWSKLSGRIFDFCINEKPATFVVLIGKNGCGKTMLLNFLLQVFVLHKFIYPTSYDNGYWWNSDKRNSDKKNVILCFNDNNHEVELNLSLEKTNTSEKFFTFSIDNFPWANDMFTPIYRLTNSSKNSSVNGKFLFKTNEIFFWMDDRIEARKIGQNLKIPPLWHKQIYEINFENGKNVLFDLSKKPSDINKILNDDLYVHNEESMEILKKLPKLKFTRKISDLFNERHNFKYDENSKLIYEDENSYYPFDSLSSGKKRNFSLTMFFEYFFHKLKKIDKSNVFSFLIDEIEKSLCPLEQQNIAEQIINYENKMKEINHQFFITTHSPFILKNFLNRNDTVIINVETGENILKSEEKKLLLNENNNVSYDEISYLYYDIPTPNYYNSLYEKLKWKFDECFTKKNSSISKSERDKRFFNFLCDIKLETLKDKIYKVDRIESSEKLKKMKMKGQKKIDVKDLDDFCDNLTLLRDMLAHDDGNANWNVEIYDYSENNQIFEKNKKNKYFYESFKELSKNKSELLLKEQIETIREILINWEKIAK